MPQLKSRDSSISKVPVQVDDSSDSNVLVSFLETTSLHGVKHTATHSKIRRVFWLLIFLGALGCWLYYSVQLWMDIADLKVNTVYKLQYTRSLEFPTLTICKTCPVRLNNYSRVVNDIMLSNSDWKLLRPDTNVTYPGGMENVTDQETTLPEDLFLQVKWNGQVVEDIASVFKVVPGERGCFVFNDKDYQAVHGGLEVEDTGFEAGLEIIANVHQRQCPGGIYDDSGLELHIHSVWDYTSEDMSNVVYGSPDVLLSPGRATYVGLGKTQVHFLPEPYTSVGDSYCSKAANYSRISCLNLCIDKVLGKMCNCVKDSTGRCNYVGLESLQCFYGNKDVVRNQAENGEICVCPYPCVLTEYVTDLSFAYFPTDEVSRRLEYFNEISDVEYARENILKVNINYRQLVEERVLYEREHTLESVIGTIGGHMGLFLGASVLTAVEVTEVCGRILISLISRIYKQKSTSNTSK